MSEENPKAEDGALTPAPEITAPLLADLQHLIRSARERAAATVNAELTMLNWHIVVRLRKEVLREQRAEYGQQVVDTISREWMRWTKSTGAAVSTWRMTG